MAEQNPIYDPKKTLGAKISREAFQVSLTASLVVIEYYVPFLVTPVVRPLFEYFYKTLFTWIYDKSEQGVAFLIIDAKVDQQNAAYKEAAKELETALQTKTKEEIEIEKQKFKDKLRALISFKP